MARGDRGKPHRGLVARRAQALDDVRAPLDRHRPLGPADEDLPLAGHNDRLGRRGDEGAGTSAALWHARYTEWAEALDWLHRRVGGQQERFGSDDVVGLGGCQAFLGVPVVDGAGNPLDGPGRDRELAARIGQGLRGAAEAGSNAPARLWCAYVLEGRSAGQAARQVCPDFDSEPGRLLDGRTFDRWTWRGGLGDPKYYPTRRAEQLRKLLRSLETTLDRPSVALPNDGLPPALLRSSAPFVGRGTELAQLRRVWEAVQQGDSGVVLISGEAGIGKSALVAEFARSIRLSTAVVASQPSLTGTRAHAELASLVRQMGGRVGHSAALAAVPLDDAGRRSLRRLNPDVFGVDADPGQQANPSGQRDALYEAIGALLRWTSRREPVVVVIEDLHKATADGLQGVLALVEQQVPRVMFVFACRERAPGSDALDKVAAIARAAGSFVRIRLRDLGADDVERLVQVTEDLPDDARPTLGSALFRRTGGHPLWVTTFLDSIVRGDIEVPSGQIDRADVPAEIGEHITGRLESVAPETRSVLQAAAVAGDEFDLEMLAHMQDRFFDEVLHAAEGIEATGLIVSLADRPGRLTFSHELIRDAVYLQLTSLQRARMHRAAAEALAEIDEPDLVVVYAHHCHQAAGTYREMLPRSVAASVAAGRDSVARLAYADAVEHFRHGLEHARSDEERANVGAALGDALWRSSLLGEARKELERAAPLAQGLRDAVLLARIATTLSAATFESSTGHPDLHALCLEALDLLPPDEVFWRVRLLTAVARQTSPLQAPQVLPDIAALSLELALRDDDPASRAYGYLIQHDALLSRLDTDERATVTTEMNQAATAANDPYLLCISHGHKLVIGLERMDPVLVDSAIEECDETAERFNYRYARWQAALYRAGRSLFQQPLSEAEAAIETAHELGEPLKYFEVDLMHLVQRAFLDRELGDIEKSEGVISTGAKVYELLVWKAGYACGLCEAEDEARRSEAAPLLGELEAMGLDRLTRDGTYPLTLGLLAEAYAYRRDRERAAELLPIVQRCLRRHPVAAGSATYWGSMHYHLGLLHATVGEHTEAITWFRRALGIDRRMKAPLWTCHTLVAFAQTLRARSHLGDRGVARYLELRARHRAERFGYIRVVQELDGLRPPHISSPGRGGPRVRAGRKR